MKLYYIQPRRYQAIVLNVGKRLVSLWFHFFFCIIPTYPDIQMPVAHCFSSKPDATLKAYFPLLSHFSFLQDSLSIGVAMEPYKG